MVVAGELGGEAAFVRNQCNGVAGFMIGSNKQRFDGFVGRFCQVCTNQPSCVWTQLDLCRQDSFVGKSSWICAHMYLQEYN